ncbi:ABC transporter ATP-binding protein [Brevibacterium sandarakinum]|uniref:ABC transporter ATP-binding protein n=1 Tax=Brevibacterium sandarakinum TaxID=629680 RepID=UPI0026501DB3|nr:ATP-binding cassette domain-containing protein [Brevibacterium sandarakinum]MDN5657134.1 ATP-binding cassette domain-containing protein [Brevibacterium sandarakinum]
MSESTLSLRPTPTRLVTMIEIKNVTKSYRRRTVLDQVSLTARPGEVTGFVGPNGAGKSTALRTILGLSRPNSGTATILGKPYAGLDHPARRVGAMLDPEALPGYLRGIDLLRWYAAAAGIDSARIGQMLERVELADDARKRINSYSFGMRQRIGLAVALLGDAEIVILDEPTNGLDPAGIRWLRELLHQLAEHGRTVLLSSHLLSEVQLLADHIVVISRGSVVADGTLSDLAGEDDLESVFFNLTGDER